MHASIPTTHVFLWFFCVFFSFLSFSSLFYLYFFLWWMIPPFTIHNYYLLYCLPWQNLPFLSLNCFWLVVGVFPRLSTSLPTAQPLPLHWIGCIIPHSQRKKKGRLVFLPLSILIILIWIRVKPLPHLPLWYASNGSSSYLLLFNEMTSQQDLSLEKFKLYKFPWESMLIGSSSYLLLFANVCISFQNDPSKLN